MRHYSSALLTPNELGVFFLSLSTFFSSSAEDKKMSAIFRFLRKKLPGEMVEKETDSNDSSEVASNNKILPPELLEKIFGHLSGQKDLSTVMLVCKTWNNVAEAPVFWSRFKITKPYQLALKRLQGCQQIVIGESWSRDKEGKITDICWRGTFQEILQHPGVKKITLHQGWLICKKLTFAKTTSGQSKFYILFSQNI